DSLTIEQDPPRDSTISENTTVRFTVTDASGNKATSCSFEIIINETLPEPLPPTFNCASEDLEVKPNADCEYVVGDYTDRITNFQNFNSPSVEQNIDEGDKITEDTQIVLSVFDDGELVDTCEFWLIIEPDDLPEITQCAPSFTATLTN